MIKQTIKYMDFNNEEREEDFYFNLNEAELAEMQLTTDGGMDEKIQKIIDAKDTKEIIALFKDLLLKSYGVKSADGKRFVKNQEIRDAFEFSAAYPVLFMQLATDAETASAFVNGILPKANPYNKFIK